MTRNPLQNLLFAWLASFFLVNAACHLSAGTNADARLASLRALVDGEGFRIDRHVWMTSDWAQPPDGHYYSNKAPGPMFVGLPLYWAWDKVVSRDHKGAALKFLSYALQLIPFLVLLFFFSRWLLANGVAPANLFLFLGAALYGNTAALMMSTYYGHGMTAVAVLAAVYFILTSRYRWTGLALGLAVLGDYSSALLLAPFLAWICVRKRRALLDVGVGALLPAGLWIWYHSSAFGSPFAIANQFQNPAYRDTLEESVQLWGIFRLPSPYVLFELLIGPSRGILWTQPWVLYAMALPAFQAISGETRRLYFVLLSSTVLLLVMNASFGGWHGGLPPGPRYLSAVFPAWAVFLALTAEPRRALPLIAVAGIFSCLVYATELSAELTPLWPFFLGRILNSPSSTIIARLAFLLTLLGPLLFFTYRSVRSRVGFSS